jgi:endonuclease-8
MPALASVDLTGWSVTDCASRGTHLLLRLVSPDASTMTLHSDLRTDGAWRVYTPGDPWRGRPTHLIRVVLRTLTMVAVGYHLHDVALVATAEEDRLVGHLGPDLLGSPEEPGGWDAAEAVRRLAQRPARPIFEALLDQRNLAGLGIVYQAEVLFLIGLSPWTPVGKINDLMAVVNLAHRLLRTNRSRWAKTTTGSLRPGEELFVHGRRGAPCRRCGTAIRGDATAHSPVEATAVDATVRGGSTTTDDNPPGFTTFWCPRCQPSLDAGPDPLPGTLPSQHFRSNW